MSDATYDRLNEERKELITEIVSSVLASVIPAVKHELGTDYLSQLTTIVSRRFDEMDAASEARHAALVRQNEERFALTATKEELAGVSKSGAENTQRIDRIEATAEARHEALIKRLDKVEDVQAQQVKSIESIKHSADTTAQNAALIRNTVDELVKRDTKRQAETEKHQADVNREITALKDSQKSDEKELREIKDDVFNNRTELNEIKSTVATEQTNARTNVQQIKDKIDGFSVSYRALDTKLNGYDSRLLTAESVMDKINAIVSGVLWLFRDRRGNVVLATMVISYFGFQALFAWLAYQFIQRMPN